MFLVLFTYSKIEYAIWAYRFWKQSSERKRDENTLNIFQLLLIENILIENV